MAESTNSANSGAEKDSSRTQSEVVAEPNQITAMIHFLGTKNKTIVGTDHGEPGIPVAGQNKKKKTA